MSRDTQFRQLEIGPPVYPPIPLDFLEVPGFLEPVQAPPTARELDQALEIRGRFLFPDHDHPYMIDIVRAFRLAKGGKAYLEVGTFDKGNLAYASGLLAPDALIIDVDIVDHPDRAGRLAGHKQPGQKIHHLVGDSQWSGIVDKVRAILGDRKLDVIFLDGNHAAQVVMSDYALYSPLLAEDGFLFIHDIYMESQGQDKGEHLAITTIDKLTPVYAVYMLLPVHRYIPNLHPGEVHGGVGIIPGRALRRQNGPASGAGG